MLDSWKTVAKDFLQLLPLRTMRNLIMVWLGLGLVANLMIEAGFAIDVARYFPISEFHGPTFHFGGLPFTILFLLVFFYALKRVSRFSGLQIWLIGLVLLVLGNLIQGSIDAAFYLPFHGYGGQYYHDAIRITDWEQWLRDFNANQLGLQNHSRTHPPFAVLLHYLILSVGNNSLFFLPGAFILLSSLPIFFVWKILRLLDLPPPKSAQLTLLFVVIPAVNIYSAVSIEGVIATCCTLFLLGIVKILKAGMNFVALLFVVAGFLLANLLTFAGTFLALTMFLIGWQQFQLNRQKGLFIVSSIAVLSGFIVYIIMRDRFGYDHFAAFFTAARYENPEGFRALHAPLEYLMTRIEGVFEIALFLSLGALALLFHREPLQLQWRDWRDDTTVIFLAGMVSLLAMFLAGAFKTGETARICLFIYPYFVLALRKLEERTLRAATIFAALQTAVMQTCAGYFW